MKTFKSIFCAIIAGRQMRIKKSVQRYIKDRAYRS